jgi:hypothetical protein
MGWSMTMPSPHDPVASGLEHAQKRVQEQVRVVERLRTDGCDTLSAERLLDIYRQVVDALRNE